MSLTVSKCLLKKNFNFFRPFMAFGKNNHTDIDITLQNECTQFILNTKRKKKPSNRWNRMAKKLCNQCWPQFAIKIFENINHNILTHRNVFSFKSIIIIIVYYGSDMWIGKNSWTKNVSLISNFNMVKSFMTPEHFSISICAKHYYGWLFGPNISIAFENIKYSTQWKMEMEKRVKRKKCTFTSISNINEYMRVGSKYSTPFSIVSLSACDFINIA